MDNTGRMQALTQIERAAMELKGIGNTCISLATSEEICDSETVLGFLGDAILSICDNMLDVGKMM